MAKPYDYDIAIIGGGAAGLTVASGAAQLGAKTLLVEKEPALGGDCLHYGCVPSKTLIATARARHMMGRAASYGLPSVDLPPVEFRDVAERIRSVIATIQKHDSVERFCSLGAKVEFGQVEFIDEHSARVNGKSVSARRWVIATGSSPSIPPVKGLKDVPYITNKEVFSLERLPASMAIMGGGPIAIEMAQAFTRLGSRVTVIEMAPRILMREDADMSGTLVDAMRAEGVSFMTSTHVVSVSRTVGGCELELKGADGNISKLSAETLLVAAGRAPNVSGMELERAGVAYSPKGVAVDARMRTSRRHIYAAGDITGGYMFTHAAGYEGGVVIANAIFSLPRKTDYTNFPWCTYSEPELASIGMNEQAAGDAGLEYSLWTEEFASNDRALAEGESVGRIKMLLGRKEKPLGVQILGPHAGEIINEWVAVMGGGVGMSALASAVHPYPTLGEINKRVAGSLISRKLFSDKVRRGLRLFFNLKGRAC